MPDTQFKVRAEMPGPHYARISAEEVSMTLVAPGIVRNVPRAVAALTFAFCIVNSASSPAQALLSVPVLAPGLHGQRLQRSAGPTIHYTISVPPGYSPTAKVPLILALHFGGNP